MSCARCQGFMVCERDETHWMNWRCINCGDHFDSVVMTNRYLSKPPAWLVAETLLASLCISPPTL